MALTADQIVLLLNMMQQKQNKLQNKHDETIENIRREFLAARTEGKYSDSDLNKMEADAIEEQKIIYKKAFLKLDELFDSIKSEGEKLFSNLRDFVESYNHKATSPR